MVVPHTQNSMVHYGSSRGPAAEHMLATRVPHYFDSFPHHGIVFRDVRLWPSRKLMMAYANGRTAKQAHVPALIIKKKAITFATTVPPLIIFFIWPIMCFYSLG